MVVILKHSALKPKGYFEITDLDGAVRQGETLQCCHCAKHWEIRPGSGTERGFCLNCNAVTCGSWRCDPCAPWEKQMEQIEEKLRG